ncbi:uncharacterized protein LOC131946828 [Physella acuta]|uniref:uncharacterized protein LOC131946828 n=1 Tax=Physella acuta TaxID=109671 RepID=UPI0027DC7987|nr:uncharacterized protein LOC131946828 [Physella acuta]
MDQLHSNEKSQWLMDDSDDLSAEDLLEMKNKLEDELRQLQIAHSTVQQQSSTSDIEELYKRVTDLQEELLEESNVCSRNELFLKRIQLGEAQCEELFNEHRNVNGTNQFVTRSLQELELATQLMRIHRETCQYQEKLDAQKLENLKLKKENLELMQKLKSSKAKAQLLSSTVAQNPDYKKLKSKIEVKSNSLEICKNILRLLVMGAEIDWKQDPELCQNLFECGEHIGI